MRVRRAGIRLAAELLAVSLILALGGCGSGEDPGHVGIVVVVDSLKSGGTVLVEAGARQLEKELSLQLTEEEWPGVDITGAVEAQRDRGADLILVVGRGELTLDPFTLDHRPPVVALNAVLRDGSGRSLGEEDGVTQVRYRVEEGAYLAGILAAGVTTSRGRLGVNPEAVVAFIGSKASPQEEAWRLGFEKGVEATDPNCAIAQYELSCADGVESARAAVEAALKLKADVFFCAPGPFSREVLALSEARGFLVIVSDVAEDDSVPSELLARVALRDDLAMFRAARLFLGGGEDSGIVEWGSDEGIVDLSVASRYVGSLSPSLWQALRQPLPRDLLLR